MHDAEIRRRLAPVINFSYKWLPIVFGCHCRPDRSFFVRGIQFPLCARCTGQLVGALTALGTLWIARPALPVLALLLVPLIADGIIQLCTAYVSTNPRRFVTGVLFGYALTVLFLCSVAAAFRYGMTLGIQLQTM